ncbi:deoxyribonuclease tatd [Favolaschia claudopus]|uniref:Deoxyribonuclease tatd n=1 Tax=Favolaschia claudopus TaxID=2862362 RepID=A0AAW0EGA2_9AGAR
MVLRFTSHLTANKRVVLRDSYRSTSLGFSTLFRANASPYGRSNLEFSPNSMHKPSSIPDKVPHYRFIDIAVNLTDPVFRGTYRGKQKHEDDMSSMLERARHAGVRSLIITGTSLEESREAVLLAEQLGFYCTVGCHPTRVTEFDEYKGGSESYLLALEEMIANHRHGKGRAVAIGECGLDYDRLHFAPQDVQKKYFRSQLSLAKKYHLPLFLHSRAAHSDFVAILREEGFGSDGGSAVGGQGGVVHSFTGSPEEALELMDMGFYIGHASSINGCSLKTEENIRTAKVIRPDRLLFETDAPWCSMTGGHSSKQYLSSLSPALKDSYFPPSTKSENFVLGKAVKGRNEPCSVGSVAWVLSILQDMPLETVTETAFKNTVDLFALDLDEEQQSYSSIDDS